jgi:hypothetical protein
MVTVTGNHFTAGDMEVLFGGEFALNIAVLNATTLTCQTPAYPIPGFVDVEVRNSNGEDTLNNGFEFLPESGAAPLNLTDVDTLDLYPFDVVHMVITGDPGALYFVFLSFGGGPIPTLWGLMGLDLPIYYLWNAGLNASGYHTVPIWIPPTGGGYFNFFTHALVDDNPPVWAMGGNNPNGSGSIMWGVN